MELRAGDQVVEDAADVAQQLQASRRGIGATAVLANEERALVEVGLQQYVRLLGTLRVAAETTKAAGQRLRVGLLPDVLRTHEAALSVIGDDGGAVEIAELGMLVKQSTRE